jgi:hypothetical protein
LALDLVGRFTVQSTATAFRRRREHLMLVLATNFDYLGLLPHESGKDQKKNQLERELFKKK